MGAGLQCQINIQNKPKPQDIKEKQAGSVGSDDKDVRPKISQDHYRHIHEQRDFTLENLSLAGYTDQLDYTDMKIEPEYEWQMDEDIIEINRQIN